MFVIVPLVRRHRQIFGFLVIIFFHDFIRFIILSKIKLDLLHPFHTVMHLLSLRGPFKVAQLLLARLPPVQVLLAHLLPVQVRPVQVPPAHLLPQ